MKATSVFYYVTPWGYRITAYDRNMQPVKECVAGNHPGSSADTLPVLDSYAPGELRPVSVDQLRIWAEKTAREVADELGVSFHRVHYDSDGETDEIETYTAQEAQEDTSALGLNNRSSS